MPPSSPLAKLLFPMNNPSEVNNLAQTKDVPTVNIREVMYFILIFFWSLSLGIYRYIISFIELIPLKIENYST